MTLIVFRRFYTNFIASLWQNTKGGKNVHIYNIKTVGLTQKQANKHYNKQ